MFKIILYILSSLGLFFIVLTLLEELVWSKKDKRKPFLNIKNEYNDNKNPLILGIAITGLIIIIYYLLF